MAAICSAATLFLVPPALAGRIVAWGRNGVGQCNVPDGNDFEMRNDFRRLVALAVEPTRAAAVGAGNKDDGVSVLLLREARLEQVARARCGIDYDDIDRYQGFLARMSEFMAVSW